MNRRNSAAWSAAIVLSGVLALTSCGTRNGDPDDCATTVVEPAAYAKTSKPRSDSKTSKTKPKITKDTKTRAPAKATHAAQSTKQAEPTAKATKKKPHKPKHHDLDICDDD